VTRLMIRHSVRSVLAALFCLGLALPTQAAGPPTDEDAPKRSGVPVAVDPVNATMSTSGEVLSTSPTR
jgi:hypothetical protein